MSTMTDIEAGRALQVMETLTEEVKALRAEVKELREKMAYGRGALWGLLTVVGMVSAAMGWAVDNLVRH